MDLRFEALAVFWGGMIAGSFARNIKAFWPKRVAGASTASLPRGEDEFLEI